MRTVFDDWRNQYEWTPGDRMSLRSIIVYKLCISKNPILRWVGNKMWGDP